MTTQLTIKSKENLDKIINVSKFANQDYLLATLVALLTQTKCEFNTDDLRILQRNEVLVATYNGDIPKELLFSITKGKQYCCTSIANATCEGRKHVS
ncbi:Uncharacterised protein [Actinobacillus pleuropneumoniae]|nr:Uncharacterised protein [Actinobacillus pleuropneumoniae]